MQPRNEKFFTRFSKGGSNVVESAALDGGVPVVSPTQTPAITSTNLGNTP